MEWKQILKTEEKCARKNHFQKKPHTRLTIKTRKTKPEPILPCISLRNIHHTENYHEYIYPYRYIESEIKLDIHNNQPTNKKTRHSCTEHLTKHKQLTNGTMNITQITRSRDRKCAHGARTRYDDE